MNQCPLCFQDFDHAPGCPNETLEDAGELDYGDIPVVDNNDEDDDSEFGLSPVEASMEWLLFYEKYTKMLSSSFGIPPKEMS